MSELQLAIKSPVGPLYLTASEGGLTGVNFDKRKTPMAEDGKAAQMKFLRQAEHELAAYFKGELTHFTVTLATGGTEFQNKVWAQLKKIPFGKTCSYRDIAERIGNPKATRAVGTANGRNPFGIIVPCHRVIAADGTLGGYAGGVERKTKLLEIERAHR